jgi:hypothetical protein
MGLSGFMEEMLLDGGASSSAEIKNLWSFTSTPPLALMASDRNSGLLYEVVST